MTTKQVLADLRMEKHLHGHKSCVTSLCFDPQSKQLVSSSQDNTIMLWNLKDKVRAYKFFGHTDIVTEARFSPTGNLIASASYDGTVRYWEPRLGQGSFEFRAHTKAVRSIDFTHDGLNLLTASNDKSVKVWSVQRRAFLSSFTGHNNWVRCVRSSHDSKTFLTASDDKTVKLFDRQNHKCIHTFNEEKVPQKALIHPNDLYIASGLRSGTVKIYDLKMFRQLQIYHCHEKDVNSIDFHPNGNYLYTVSNDGTMKILDLLEGRSLYTLNGKMGALTSVTCAPNGKNFVFGGVDGQILLWEADFDEIHLEDEDDSNELTGESKSSDLKKKGEECLGDKEIKEIMQANAQFVKEMGLNKSSGAVEEDFISLSAKMDSVLDIINKISLQLELQNERIKELESKQFSSG